ncbi:MAG: DUF58 domain-containing protein [Clostridia bacterium]|nr:DUF58 domain-containing protein [Clostridia bacterium]
MFFYTVVSLAMISFLYTLVILLRFKYLQDIDKKFVMKGDKVNFIFSVHNEDFLLYPYIKVTFFGSETLFKKQFQSKSFSLAPLKEKNYSLELECKYRGSYEIGVKSFEIDDFLGIFKLKYNLNETKYVTVYPRIIYLDRFKLQTNFSSETQSITNGRFEDTTMISDIRKYTYGDSLKKIHWKLSAKMNDFLVKNHEGSTETSTVILLDLKKNPFTVEENTIIEDKLIESAVAIIYYCLSNWIPIHLVYYKDQIVDIEAKNPLCFDDIYKTLSKIMFIEKIDVKDLLNVYLKDFFKKTNILILTSNISYELYSEIYKTKFSGYEISFVYVSPEEVTGVNDTEADNILSYLPEIGVDTYKINISDDIKHVLER